MAKSKKVKKNLPRKSKAPAKKTVRRKGQKRRLGGGGPVPHEPSKPTPRATQEPS